MDLSGLYIKGSGAYRVDEITTAVPGLLEVGDKVLTCTSAGTVAFPSKQAYGEWEFDWYKGADANNLNVAIISDRIAGYSNINGYWFLAFGDERFYLMKTANPTGTAIMRTDTAYFDNTTWYRVKITRTLDGEFYVYVKGGDFGIDDWTLISVSTGSNPVTDFTYTTSKYFVLDLDAGDRIANIVMRKAVQQ